MMISLCSLLSVAEANPATVINSFGFICTGHPRRWRPDGATDLRGVVTLAHFPCGLPTEAGDQRCGRTSEASAPWSHFCRGELVDHRLTQLAEV